MPDQNISTGVLPPADDVVSEALAGLTSPRKTLPPKLFYDAEGCRLFGAITRLPEYYVTRTERALLREIAPSLAEAAPAGAALVEYGASDEGKARLLLDAAAGHFAAYVPIDVAATALDEVARRLARDLPDLLVSPVEADFMTELDLPDAVGGMARLGFFPGSTIGNLGSAAATRFLRQAARTLGPEAHFVVGVDLRKDPAVLLPAYDDAQGVTAAFNRNLLVRLNREAGADFVPSAFAHRAVWNGAASRIEMHLVSLRPQVVHLGGETIRFERGESIHTENSYKYSPERFEAIAAEGGWRPKQMWTDPARLFSVHLLAGEQAG
jgi:dimethylhistidine N-methyltransferase